MVGAEAGAFVAGFWLLVSGLLLVIIWKRATKNLPWPAAQGALRNIGK